MTSSGDSEAVTIRRGLPRDHEQVVRLAQLESARVPPGEVLVAEVAGQVVAAISLADGSCVADPFVLTRDVVQLLRARAAQLWRSGKQRTRRGSRVVAWLNGLRGPNRVRPFLSECTHC
jgi:hypothetical protein